jgi:hypothetical protein
MSEQGKPVSWKIDGYTASSDDSADRVATSATTLAVDMLTDPLRNMPREAITSDDVGDSLAEDSLTTLHVGMYKVGDLFSNAVSRGYLSEVVLAASGIQASA